MLDRIDLHKMKQRETTNNQGNFNFLLYLQQTTG